MKTVLRVTGMHCSACEMLIKDVLEEREGVMKVDVSLKGNSVSVEFDESKIGEQAIKRVIKENGYGVA